MRRGLAGLVLAAIAVVTLADSANAQDALQWGGFALLRASSFDDPGPLEADSLSAQVQLGVDWFPTARFNAHVHLLGRTEELDTIRGRAGIVEAYVDANFRPKGDRVRLRGGAFFLPTSRENVDALWESPYTITPSALNSWLGEELRPIGIDAAYFKQSFVAGATIFRGNDTFGALPPVRGWAFRDHWILLGEWIHVEEEDYTSASAENDGSLGWSGRLGWNGDPLSVQATFLDNQSDALPYGHLYNWDTRFSIVSAEYAANDWTIATEYGWGPTTIVVGDGRAFTSDLSATYLLVSRRFSKGRASIRADIFDDGEEDGDAITLAYFWTPPGRLRVGAELTATDDDHRLLLEARYSFSGR